MTIIDAIIILIVLGGLVLGYRKGFIGQLSSLVSWVVAIVLCYKCGDLAKDIFLPLSPVLPTGPCRASLSRPFRWPLPSLL